MIKRVVSLVLIISIILSGCSNSDVVTEEKTTAVEATEGLKAENKVQKLEVISTTPEYDKTRYEMALQVKDAIEKLGVDIEVKPIDLKVLVNTIKTEPWEYDAYVKGWGGTNDRIDPHTFLYSILHSEENKDQGLNRQGYNNPEYDKIVEEAETTMDIEKRKELLLKAQEMLVDTAGFFPIYYEDQYQAYNKDRLEDVVIQGGIGIYNYGTFINAKVKTGDNIIKVAQRQANDLLNPMSSVLFTDRLILDLVYDSLARLNENNEPIPSAAESWKVIDDKTVEVKLKSNQKFHDGIALTAEDVKFTFEFGKKWGFGKFDSYVKPVASVEVIDPLTLRFTLEEPIGYFITTSLVSVPILPKHIWNDITTNENIESPLDYPNTEPIGSGPFKFSYWRRGEEIRLDAFKDYHTPANVGAVIEKPYANPDSILGALENGEVDMVAEQMNSMQIDQAKKIGNLEVAKTIGIGFAMFGINMRRKPFSDLAFRKAMAHVINVDEITDIVAADHATPAGVGRVISPSNKFWYNDNLQKYEYNIETARQILKDAGYAWDEDGKLYYPDK